MSQHSDERAPQEIAAQLPKAQILQFERPQSELQKAVQQRAQELIDRERDRAAKNRPAPWRRALVLVLAAVPVFITFGAAITFVGALRQFNAAVFDSAEKTPAPKSAESTPASAPTSAPDVVMLQPYVMPDPPASDSGNPTVTRDGP